MGKQERKDRRERKFRDAISTAEFRAKIQERGLPWIDDVDARAECVTKANEAGWTAALDSAPSLAQRWEQFKSGIQNPIAFAKGIRTENKEGGEAFDRAWEDTYRGCALQAEPEPEPEGRAQVDIAAVAGALPWQAAAMMGGEKKTTPRWYWAVPAGLLFLIFQRGR